MHTKTIALLAVWPLFFGFTGHEPDPTVIGDWLLQESSTSGCFTSTLVVYKSNERHIMHFSLPNRYTMTSNDTLVASGTFELTPHKKPEAPEGEPKLRLNPQHTPGSTLTLITDQPTLLNSTAYPNKRTVYELTGGRLVIGSTLGTLMNRSVYARLM